MRFLSNSGIYLPLKHNDTIMLTNKNRITWVIKSGIFSILLMGCSGTESNKELSSSLKNDTMYPIEKTVEEITTLTDSAGNKMVFITEMTSMIDSNDIRIAEMQVKVKKAKPESAQILEELNRRNKALKTRVDNLGKESKTEWNKLKADLKAELSKIRHELAELTLSEDFE